MMPTFNRSDTCRQPLTSAAVTLYAGQRPVPDCPQRSVVLRGFSRKLKLVTVRMLALFTFVYVIPSLPALAEPDECDIEKTGALWASEIYSIPPGCVIRSLSPSNHDSSYIPVWIRRADAEKQTGEVNPFGDGRLGILDRQAGRLSCIVDETQIREEIDARLGSKWANQFRLSHLFGRVTAEDDRIVTTLAHESERVVITLRVNGDVEIESVIQLGATESIEWQEKLFLQFFPHGDGFLAEYVDMQTFGRRLHFFTSEGVPKSAFSTSAPSVQAGRRTWTVVGNSLGTVSSEGMFVSSGIELPPAHLTKTWSPRREDILLIQGSHALMLQVSHETLYDGNGPTLRAALVALDDGVQTRISRDDIEGRMIYGLVLLDYDLERQRVLLYLHLAEEEEGKEETISFSLGDEMEVQVPFGPKLRVETGIWELNFKEDLVVHTEEYPYSGRFPLLFPSPSEN